MLGFAPSVPFATVLVAFIACASGVGCRRPAPPPGAGSGPITTGADAGSPARGPGTHAAVVLVPAGQPEARVTVELARSDAERARGLMHRRHLPSDAGMLFLFDTDEVQVFWMKNTLIPLDMIFIRGDLTVAGVVESAEPLTLEGRKVDAPSRYVLEVNGGWARDHGVTAGTRVRFEAVPVP